MIQKELMKKITIVALAACTGVLVYAYKTNKIKQQETMKNGSMESSIITLPSGLRYQIIQSSDNATVAQSGTTVTVHYTGWLNKNDAADKKFDSSVDRNKPFTFKLGIGQVIKGWDEGVAGMKIGEKRRLFIPANLGYGTRGAGAIIPPDSALIFDVELISVA